MDTRRTKFPRPSKRTSGKTKNIDGWIVNDDLLLYHKTLEGIGGTSNVHAITVRYKKNTSPKGIWQSARRALKEAGIEHYWFVVEFSTDGCPHIHGEVILQNIDDVEPIKRSFHRLNSTDPQSTVSINKASIVWAGYCGKDRPDRVITTNYVRSEAYAVYTEMYGEVLSRFYRNAWATIQRHKDNQTAKRAANEDSYNDQSAPNKLSHSYNKAGRQKPPNKLSLYSVDRDSDKAPQPQAGYEFKSARILQYLDHRPVIYNKPIINNTQTAKCVNRK